MPTPGGATFEEAQGADLLLVVVDASDPSRDDHVRTTMSLLGELGLALIPQARVYNKIDLLDPMELAVLRKTQPDGVFVSATKRETTRPLLERIAEILQERWTRAARTPEAGMAEERNE